jgi:hypothetical protein
MAWRLFALSAGMIVAGARLIVAPIDQGRVYSTNLDSGQWLDVPVPVSTSWSGSAIYVQLSWGTAALPSNCFGVACPSRDEPSPSNFTYLMVFDCGPTPCTWGRNYSYVGSTDLSPGGNSAYPGIPGHHYQVWLMGSSNSSRVTSVPVRYALETPIFGEPSAPWASRGASSLRLRACEGGGVGTTPTPRKRRSFEKGRAPSESKLHRQGKGVRTSGLGG